MIPNFHEKTFPFLIMSGESSFNILNVMDGHFEPLINAATSVKHAQTAFFFTQEGHNLSMHFTTTRSCTDLTSVTTQNWHKMRFKYDMLKVLKDNGCLPVNTPE